MKKLLFISTNKILGQSLSSVIRSNLENGFEWTTQLNYVQAIVGIDIIRADMVIFDIVDQIDMNHAVEICRLLRERYAKIKILFLVRPEQDVIRNKSIAAQNTGLINNFVFYDNSMNYLLAKLAAL